MLFDKILLTFAITYVVNKSESSGGIFSIRNERDEHISLISTHFANDHIARQFS